MYFLDSKGHLIFLHYNNLVKKRFVSYISCYFPQYYFKNAKYAIVKLIYGKDSWETCNIEILFRLLKVCKFNFHWNEKVPNNKFEVFCNRPNDGLEILLNFGFSNSFRKIFVAAKFQTICSMYNPVCIFESNIWHSAPNIWITFIYQIMN